MSDRTIDARHAARILNKDLLDAFHAESGVPPEESSEETIWVLLARDGRTVHRREYDFTAVGMASLLKDLHDWLEKGSGYSAVQHVGKEAPSGFTHDEPRRQVSASSR